jgi:hypothetical protein
MKILSFDGGPAAALQIRILKSAELSAQARGQSVIGEADVLAGSSDGSFMSSFLALRMWQGEAPGPKLIDEATTFSNELLDAFQVSFCDLLRFLSGLRPLLPVSAVQSVLAKYLGTATLGNLAGPGPTGARPRYLMLMSFDIKTWQPKQFRNFGEPNLDLDTPLVDAVLSSCAFPMLLPVHTQGPRQFVDGAMVANNPAMAALTAVLRFLQKKRGDENQPRIPSRELLAGLTMLSLGGHESIEVMARREGCKTTDLRKQLASLLTGMLSRGPWGSMPWGYLQWFLMRPLYLLDLFFQASVEEVSLQASSLLDQQYFRGSPGFAEMTEVFGVLFGSPQRLEKWLDDQAHAYVAESRQYQEMLLWLEQRWYPEADVK